MAGRTIAVPRTALVIATTNVGLDWLELPRSDAAQQLSACDCVSTPVGPELGESRSCIGHPPPWEQHAMRAAGVGIHPAHTAALLAARARPITTAETRLNQFTIPKDAEYALNCQTASG